MSHIHHAINHGSSHDECQILSGLSSILPSLIIGINVVPQLLLELCSTDPL